MATSGSINFSTSTSDIIQQALEHLNIIGADETPSAEDYDFAKRTLNSMVKSWAAQGGHLWSQDEGYIFLQDSVGEYSLVNSASGAYATTNAVITQLSVAAAATNTTITVDSTSGMTAGDIIGIIHDDDSADWTTISSVDSATVLTLNDAITDAAAIDNMVFSFTSRLNRPMRIDMVMYVTGTGLNQSERQLRALSREEFFRLPNKNQVSTPTGFYYDPQIGVGKLYLWPKPSDPEGYLKIYFERTLEDFDSSSDEPDFPQEWYDALIYGLAARLGPAFGRAGDQNFQDIKKLAEITKNDALIWDRETAYVQFKIMNRG